MANHVKFNIKCNVDERWKGVLCSFLKELEKNGSIGHSSLIAIFADGDGSFRPKFEIEGPYLIHEPKSIVEPKLVELTVYDKG